MTVKVGDTVVYHETSGEEHEAKVVAINGPETISLEFKSHGRDRRAEHLSSSPGITGECWMTKEDAARQAKARESELKAKAEDSEKIEDAEEAKDSDGGTNEGENMEAPEQAPETTSEDAQNDAPQEEPTD